MAAEQLDGADPARPVFGFSAILGLGRPAHLDSVGRRERPTLDNNLPTGAQRDTVSIILETPRLLLRHQQASDIEFLVDLWSDPLVTAYLGGPRDTEWLRREFAQTAERPAVNRYDLWPALEKTTLRPVGHCGLLEKDIEGKAEVELNYILMPSAWGIGYATEVAGALKLQAFGMMGLHRLVALVHPHNDASERVAIRVGMRLENVVTRPGGASRKLYSVQRA